jgi:hypothetical protein
MKLHPIKHDLPGVLWCGPAALSACCNVPTSVIHNIIKGNRPGCRGPVKGVANSELRKAAEFLGFRLELVYDYWADKSLSPRKKPTLAAFTRNFRPYLQDYPVIVNVTGHYVVVHRRTFVDNQVKTPMSLCGRPSQKAWQVVPKWTDDFRGNIAPEICLHPPAAGPKGRWSPLDGLIRPKRDSQAPQFRTPKT